MAQESEESFYDPLDDDDETSPKRRWSFALALGALSAFVWLAWYTYDVGTQVDSPDQVPMIQAEADPVRTRPDDPGGMEVPHQDKAVYETLARNPEPALPNVENVLPNAEEPMNPAAAGYGAGFGEKEVAINREEMMNPDAQAQPQVEQLVGEPPVTPTEITEEASAAAPADALSYTPPTTPVGGLEQPKETAAAEEPFTTKQAARDMIAENDKSPAAATEVKEVAIAETAVKEELPKPKFVYSTDSKPAEKASAEKSPAKIATNMGDEPKHEAAAVKKEVVPAVMAAPQPHVDLASVNESAADTAPVKPLLNGLEPAAGGNEASVKKAVEKEVEKKAEKPSTQKATGLASGPRLQLGAYRSHDEATRSWGKINSRFKKELKGQEYVIEKADLGAKGVFYRLQSPVPNASKGEALCDKLSSKNQGCFVVKR